MFGNLNIHALIYLLHWQEIPISRGEEYLFHLCTMIIKHRWTFNYSYCIKTSIDPSLTPELLLLSAEREENNLCTLLVNSFSILHYYVAQTCNLMYLGSTDIWCESSNIFILVDNRPCLLDNHCSPTHLWQVMVTSKVSAIFLILLAMHWDHL